jgi:hypothetical protein
VPGWRVLLRRVLRPVGRAVARAAVVVVAGLVRAARWIGRALAALWPPFRRVVALILAPVAYVAVWLRRGFVALGRVLLWPLGVAAAWLGRGLAALWRAVLRPLLTAVARLVAYAWRLAGRVLFALFVWPARLVWRAVCRPFLRAPRRVWRATVVPAARGLRVHVWEPARAAGRSVSRTLGLDARRP